MTALQKKLLLVFAALLAFQAGVNLIEYLSEVSHGGRFGGDFISFWQAGHRVRQGDIGAIYAPDAWRNVLTASRPHTITWFVYPPFALFGLWPLGHMTYDAAVCWWSLAPLPFYFGLALLLAKRSGLGRNAAPTDQNKRSQAQAYAVLGAITLPFVSANLFSGQTGAFIAVFYLAAAYFWSSRPVLAGICIGLLAVKPQMGLLLPVALVAAGQWRTIAAAAVTIAALSAAATLCFGAAIWADYLRITQIFSHVIGQGYDGIRQLALSPYVSLQSVGAPTALAAFVQAAVSLTVLVLIFHVFSQGRARAQGRADEDRRQDLRLALLATGTLLATPYALSYDTPLLVLSVIPLLTRAWARGWDGLELAAVAALAAMPYAQTVLIDVHIPFGFGSLLLAFCALYRRYRQDAQVRRAGPALSADGRQSLIGLAH